MKLNQLVAGTPAPLSRRKYRDLDKRLLKVVETYDQVPVSEYLLGIAHNTKLQV